MSNPPRKLRQPGAKQPKKGCCGSCDVNGAPTFFVVTFENFGGGCAVFNGSWQVPFLFQDTVQNPPPGSPVAICEYSLADFAGTTNTLLVRLITFSAAGGPLTCEVTILTSGEAVAYQYSQVISSSGFTNCLAIDATLPNVLNDPAPSVLCGPQVGVVCDVSTQQGCCGLCDPAGGVPQTLIAHLGGFTSPWDGFNGQWALSALNSPGPGTCTFSRDNVAVNGADYTIFATLGISGGAGFISVAIEDTGLEYAWELHGVAVAGYDCAFMNQALPVSFTLGFGGDQTATCTLAASGTPTLCDAQGKTDCFTVGGKDCCCPGPESESKRAFFACIAPSQSCENFPCGILLKGPGPTWSGSSESCGLSASLQWSDGQWTFNWNSPGCSGSHTFAAGSEWGTSPNLCLFASGVSMPGCCDGTVTISINCRSEGCLPDLCGCDYGGLMPTAIDVYGITIAWENAITGEKCCIPINVTADYVGANGIGYQYLGTVTPSCGPQPIFLEVLASGDACGDVTVKLGSGIWEWQNSCGPVDCDNPSLQIIVNDGGCPDGWPCPCVIPTCLSIGLLFPP